MPFFLDFVFLFSSLASYLLFYLYYMTLLFMLNDQFSAKLVTT